MEIAHGKNNAPHDKDTSVHLVFINIIGAVVYQFKLSLGESDQAAYIANNIFN